MKKKRLGFLQITSFNWRTLARFWALVRACTAGLLRLNGSLKSPMVEGMDQSKIRMCRTLSRLQETERGFVSPFRSSPPEERRARGKRRQRREDRRLGYKERRRVSFRPIGGRRLWGGENERMERYGNQRLLRV
ncbi:hypothetical protein BHE74_00022777 [Ensete ventricosum]|uniref:Uncharacterized protein n=1 Tax=Ensete ventricosum TaxID=4639 RepID=A0A444EZK4_ENSVE|nr:hypothetical protein B296_00024310 [Ensete ventricosum]RWW15749.1 hypothetical protein GW17_00020395 [Ensete ventricosum]RWW69605.1 hypothetical protein BHE74_00022777 [Ensete ventricosum]